MPMHRDSPLFDLGLTLTRRRFFARTAGTLGAALGTSALGYCLGTLAGRAPSSGAPGRSPVAPKARRVIYMHMEGAPSQIDLFDYKPDLRERFDQDLPDSIRAGQRLTGMTSGQARFPVAPSIFKFTRYRNHQDGAWVSELLPHTGRLAHELCFVRS